VSFDAAAHYLRAGTLQTIRQQFRQGTVAIGGQHPHGAQMGRQVERIAQMETTTGQQGCGKGDGKQA